MIYSLVSLGLNFGFIRLRFEILTATFSDFSGGLEFILLVSLGLRFEILTATLSDFSGGLYFSEGLFENNFLVSLGLENKILTAIIVNFSEGLYITQILRKIL